MFMKANTHYESSWYYVFEDGSSIWLPSNTVSDSSIIRQTERQFFCADEGYKLHSKIDDTVWLDSIYLGADYAEDDFEVKTVEEWEEWEEQTMPDFLK